MALVGSLRYNWPEHPPLLVYDLGMRPEKVDEFKAAGIDVIRVPEFCPHMRRHFTWKVWCIHEAPCDQYIWLDAGVYVLRPMPDVFEAISNLGYFVIPTGLMIAAGMCRPLADLFMTLSRNASR